MSVPESTAAPAVAALTAQVAALSTQVAALSDEIRYLRAESRPGAPGPWAELADDVAPVMREAFDVVAEELAELEPYVRSDDLIALARRLARNTRTFDALLEQLESARDLVVDATPLAAPVVGSVAAHLDALERRGYVASAREGLQVVDRVVTTFGPDDIRQLGDNIVLILSTVKAMTQPEIMNLVGNLTAAYRQADRDTELPTSTLALLREMRDPEVRRGLALVTRMLRVVARQNAAGSSNGSHG